MKRNPQLASALTFALLVTSVLAPWAARADLTGALAERLASPIARVAFGASADARVVASRVLGESTIIRTYNPEAWQLQSRELAETLSRRQAASAEELYLRVLRMEDRFRARFGNSSAVEAGRTELPADEVLELQRLAAEELGLKEISTWGRLTRGNDGLASRLEFVRVAPAQGSIGYLGARQRFLLGMEGSSRLTTAERALENLRQLAEADGAPFMLIRSDEGGRIAQFARGRGMYNGDPMMDVINGLAADPAKKDVAIALSHRLNQAVEAWSATRARYGIPARGEVRKATLRRIAKMFLANELAADGSLRFLPMTAGK